MAIVILDDGSPQSRALHEELGFPLEEQPIGYNLVWSGEQWVVRDPRQGPHFMISLDFKKQRDVLAQQRVSVKKDLLCRALGFKGQSEYCVIDGTLGFAKDALHMLTFGIHVIGCEKSPVTFKIVDSAQRKEPLLLKDFSVHQGDCLDLLPRYSQRADVLYLDPMFENAKKKSAPKKALAFLREVADSSFDVQRVIEEALKLGVKRVVVKRPLKGQQLYDKPNIVFEGKLIRYDVYTG